MDLEKYRPMLKKKQDLMNQIYVRIQRLPQEDPAKFREVSKPIQDNSIDPGDKEELQKYLMKFVKGLQEYKALKSWRTRNSDKMKELYKQLAKSKPAEMDDFMDFQLDVVNDVFVDLVFQMLLQTGAVDKRKK
ncbi:hypothetical protein GF342_04580 [Candidatus Woesearchaeota archaeon]|nr:hypothetical protein [Candidatus Woesearchaeota archaeon]